MSIERTSEPEKESSAEAVTEDHAEARGLLEAITESIPVGFALLDPEGRLSRVSARAEALLGLKRDEIVGRRCSDGSWRVSAIGGEAFPEEQRPFRRVIASSAAVFDVRFAVERPDGTRVPLSVNAAPIRHADGSLRGVLATFEEIRELVDAEEALRASEARYGNLFNSMHDAFSLQEIICDESGKPVDYRFLDVNPAFEKMTGIPAEEWIGRRVREILPETEAHWIELCGEVALTGNARRIEQHAQAFDRHYEVLAYSPQRGQIAALCTDVTERKRAEESVRERSRLDATATLAGGIAHDFNNLMVGVIGNAELARVRWGDNAELAELMDGVIEAGQRAGALARQMLAFARSGQHIPKLMRLENAIGETLRLQERTLPPQVEITTKIDPELWSLRADHSQLVQVIMNLCLNAAESIEGRGHITLEAHNVELPSAAPQTDPELSPGHYLVLTVRDTGRGMDAKTRSRIFEPFYSTKAHGRGLGLAAVRGIVEGHGGAIEAKSQLGEGTTFEVYLPATPERPGVTAPAVSEPQGGGATVLLIDDDTGVLDPTRTNLELLGYQVLVADSGRQALQIAKSHPGKIAIAILDLSMPGMSGREVFPQLMELRPDIKVLLCSGHDIDGDAQSLLESGASGFFRKPFLARDLAQRLHDLLDE